jgi:hypothetical protein
VKNLLRVFKVAFLVGLLLFLAVLFGRPGLLPDFGWFNIEVVTLSVEAPVVESEVRKAAGKLEGVSLLRLNSAKLVQVIRENAWVQDVSIKKNYPNHLAIQVQAKKPVAAREEAGKLIFLEADGSEIDRWSSERGAQFDVPLISFEKQEGARLWSSKQLVGILLSMQAALSPKHRLSQIVASDPPYFRIFLASPPIETLFSLHTWETQMPLYLDLLSRPPKQIGQAHKINLVFPKKAVVSFPLSN